MCNYRQLNTGVGVMCGWCFVLKSSSTLYGKVPRLAVKETNRLTQAVVYFRRHFLCAALLCNCLSAERGGLSAHVQRECSAEPFTCKNPVSKNLHISPRFSRTIFYRDANLVLLLEHFFTATLYAQHPASLAIFPSLPGSRLRLLMIPMPI